MERSDPVSMANMTTHGAFDPEVLEKALAELNDENFEFSEGTERSTRSGAGYPSLGGFIDQHFDFGEEPVSNFYTSDLRRLRDALKIAQNNVAKGYSYGSHERVAELRAQMRDLLGQHMRNLAAAQEAAGDPYGTPDNCCTGEPGHGPTGVKVHTDNRGALIPEYAEEPEWSKPLYDAMQKAAALNEEILSHYSKYEHEVRMMRYGAADTHFAAIRTLSEDFRNAYPVKDFQWDKDLRALEIRMHDAPSYEARLPLQKLYMKLQSRYYKDFKGMPWPDMAAQGYVPTYSEEGGDSAPFDFARCQRPDGSFYGTGGQCRKGTPAGAKQKDEVGTGKPSKAVKSGALGEMTIKTRADMKKMSDEELKSHMKLANKAAFQNDVSKLTKAQFDGLADQHKMAKAELDRRGKSRDQKREANVKLNSALQDGPKATPKQRAQAVRQFTRQRNLLKSKIDDLESAGKPVPKALRARLKLVDGAIKAQS